MIVMGIDIGLAALGWAVIDADAGGVTRHVVDAHVITTKRETKKRQLHTGSDDARRIDLLVAGLSMVIRRHRPIVVGYELPAGSHGARAAHALGLAHGFVRATCGLMVGLALEVSARDIKQIITGNPNASKEAMIESAARVWPDISRITKGQREHAADAIGIAQWAACQPVTLSAERVRAMGGAA